MWPVEESPLLASHEPLLLNQLETEASQFGEGMIGHWVEMGMKSACWLPLLHRGRLLGGLIIASKQESSFNQKDVSLLAQLANQVAIAIDNAETFRQVSELKDRLVEEKVYLEEEIRTEYNFEEMVGESAPLKRVLKQVETVAPTEATVLIGGTGPELRNVVASLDRNPGSKVVVRFYLFHGQHKIGDRLRDLALEQRPGNGAHGDGETKQAAGKHKQVITPPLHSAQVGGEVNG